MDDDYFGYEKPTSYTDAAQICLNGHIVNDSFHKSPQLNKKHCPKCGEPTIIECPACNNPIAGEIHYSNVWGAHSFKLPGYCIECGNPYPWTVAKLQAAKDIAAELDELSAEEKRTLEKSIGEISKDNVQAQVGATRIKKIIGKVSATTGNILQKIIVDVASEAAKKTLLGL